MKDNIGLDLAVGDIVAWLGDQSVSLARVMRFTPKRVEIAFAVWNMDGDKISSSLTVPHHLLKLTVSPELQEILDKKGL